MRVVIDFETYYDKEFSLTGLSNQQYVRDPRFEAIGGAFSVDGAEPVWYTDTALDGAMAWLRQHQATATVVAHNAVFDGSILAWRYGVYPMKLLCTVSMARSLGLQAVVGGSLAALADLMRAAGVNVPPKGTEVVNALGKRRRDFTPQQLDAYGNYCKDDVRITAELYRQLVAHLPPDELEWQSSVTKMYTNSVLQTDLPTVTAELARVRERRAQAGQRLADAMGVSDFVTLMPILNSAPKFAEALTLFGAEVPKKISKTTGEETYALSKTDPAFLAMQEHENEFVRELVIARLGLKSSIEETRCTTLIELHKYGHLPIPYKISGALTHRLSGGEEA